MKSLWDHFWLMRVTLVQFGITLQSLWSHSGYTKVRFQKTLIFPHRLQWFYKMPGNDMSDRKANFAYDHVDSYAIWVHFGSMLGRCWIRFVFVRSDRKQIRFGSAPSRPQVGPKSARKQIKHILPKDFDIPRPTVPTPPHRNSPPGNSKRYQSANPYD